MTPDQGSFAGVRTGEFAVERTDKGVSVLTITGEHDLSTAPNLRRRLDGMLDDRTGIIIDLSQATFIDSSILGVILEGKKRATDTGTGFAVLHANGADAVGRVLEVTGLRAELPVLSERKEAYSVASDSSEGGDDLE